MNATKLHRVAWGGLWAAMWGIRVVGAAVSQDGGSTAPNAPATPDEPVVSYDAHRVVRVEVHSDDDVKRLLELTDDVWSHRVENDRLDVRVSPQQLAQLEGAGLAFEVLIEDVQALIDAEAREIAARAQMRDLAWFDNYKNFAQIESQIDVLVAAYPALVEHVVVGQSILGRDIHALSITGTGGSASRPTLVIIGCQHAREWIAAMTTMFFADRLLENYAGSARIRSMLDRMEIVIVPMMNPDGYVYTWSSDRLWRKNRNPNPGLGCAGVDLNRNWDYHWGEPGADHEPCSGGNDNSYHGTAAFSEPEVDSVATYIALLSLFGADIVGFLDIHSYSQLVLSPWGYTCAAPPSTEPFNTLGQKMTDAILSVHGESYIWGPACSTLYQASGTSKDWAYGAADALSWTIELRDNGLYGFLLPPEQIRPTGEETFEALLQLAEHWTKATWVDFAYASTERGTFREPYNTLAEGAAAVTTGGRVVMKPGAQREVLTITRAMTLEAYRGSATVGD